MYWSKKHSISTPYFRSIMPCNRFYEIHKFLHFVDNEDFDCNTHPNLKLYKVCPVLQHLNELFQRAVTPGHDIVIDETLFKGRLGWRQYMPKKRSRYEVKSYLCESSSGCIWSQIIHTGKGMVFDAKYKDLPQSVQVVIKLLSSLF
ncbi:piggyBac transposable element-derived protein 4-like [Stegodyphus dumicola]|uniref:piggyBac transposable element-derived protein 4-like n=1 Tax=Stegodyphus dumicola TaxID=202533 RepID=UPI0015AB3B4A|nr:piggyBac transposable element-derived protein 4-like [Stegodyphus dumicola]